MTTQRHRALLALLAIVLTTTGLTFASTAAHAAGVGVNINGSTSATVITGGTVTMTWSTVDVDTATGRTHQDGTPVSFPAWDGPKTVGPLNSATITVDLPPGQYFLVIEGSSGGPAAVSSVGLTVLPDPDAPVVPEPPTDPGPPAGPTAPVPALPDPASPGASPVASDQQPTVAPRAGVA